MGNISAKDAATILRESLGLSDDTIGLVMATKAKHLRGDINYAWPSAEIAVMGPKGAIEVLYHKNLAGIEDPSEREVEFHKYENEYKTKFANPYDAAKYGFIDDIIVPRNTRFRVIRAFQALSTKKDTNPAKKHSNLPL